jgi:hypothetical protein
MRVTPPPPKKKKFPQAKPKQTYRTTVRGTQTSFLNPRFTGYSRRFLFSSRCTEMEVTEIILAQASRLCQLSRHSRGVLSRLWIFKSIVPSLRIYWGGGEGGRGEGGCFFTLFNFVHILLNSVCKILRLKITNSRTKSLETFAKCL